MRERLPMAVQALALTAAALLMAAAISWAGGRLFGEWKLVLQSFALNGTLLGLAAVLTVAVACILMLFQYERRLVSPVLGNTLLVLRLLAVLVLFLTLLEPVWTWSYEDRRSGRVVVAVDASESMDTIDDFATPAEKLRWAKALGLVGGEERSEQLDQWIRAYEEGKEPEWVPPGETADPLRRDQLARARKENIEAALKEVDKLSRKNIARRIVWGQSQSLLPRLTEHVQAATVVFAGKSMSADPDELGTILDDAALDVQRGISDLTQPVQSALAGSADPPLVGIVLLSDGRDTAHRETSDLLAGVTGLGIPIHTVLIGSSRRPRDLSVAAVDHPETVFLSDTPVVTATIQQSGFDGKEVLVHLEPIDAPGEQPLTQPVRIEADLAEVSFPLPELSLGQHRYRLRVETQPDETRDDNNVRELALQVVDDRAQLLLVEGEARWEFRYLEALFKRDEQVQADVVLFDQPYLSVLPTTFFPRKLNLGDPADPAGTTFKPFDAVIVGDVAPIQLGVNGWRAIDRYVRDEGGTLILVAGRRYLPAAYSSSEIVQGLLPIENPRVLELNDASQQGSPHQRGFRLQITPDGQVQDMFLMDADPAQNRRIWQTLPGHPWGIAGTAKPAATVWATALVPGEPTGLEAERRNALIVQRYVGEGQVIWIGVDSTWRWRLRVGDVYHHRFWGQLARAVVEFKGSDLKGIAKFGLARPIISEAEEAVIRVRWDDRFLKQNPGVKGKAVISPAGIDDPAQQRTVELRPLHRQRNEDEGRIGKLKPGQYNVRLEVEGAEVEGVLPEVPLTVVRELTAELRDVSADRELLQEMARVSGGKFFLPDEVGQIPELFTGVARVTSIREEIPLWSHWGVLALFAGVVTAEWVLRKLNGLP